LMDSRIRAALKEDQQRWKWAPKTDPPWGDLGA
jgi:hypothetical protein